jgi:predicted nucleotidyltransferase
MPNGIEFLSTQEKQALSEIKRRVSAVFQVRQYLLFGSKARGDAREDSDVDLLIVTGSRLTSQDRGRISHEIFEVNLACDTNFSYIVIDADEWEEGMTSVMPFHDNVLRDGVLV